MYIHKKLTFKYLNMQMSRKFRWKKDNGSKAFQSLIGHLERVNFPKVIDLTNGINVHIIT